MELMDFQRHFQEVEIKRRSQRTEGERRTVFSEKNCVDVKNPEFENTVFSDRIVVNLNSRIHEQNEFFYKTHLEKGEKETRNRVMLEFKACQSHVYHNFHPNCSVILEGPSWFNSTKRDLSMQNSPPVMQHHHEKSPWRRHDPTPPCHL